MSRTNKTRPTRFGEREGRLSARTARVFDVGVGKQANFQEHRARQRVRLALVHGDEPEPTRHRHNAQYGRYGPAAGSGWMSSRHTRVRSGRWFRPA